MRFVWIVAVILGTSAGFGGGYMTATQLSRSAQQDVLRQELLKRHDAARQEILKELVAAKAGIETGLAVADLRNSEKQVRAALDLGLKSLNERQKQAAVEALHAISQTVGGWDETFRGCHAGREGYVYLVEDTDGRITGDPNCNNKKLERIYTDMGVLPALTKWTENPNLTLAPKRNTLLQPLFSVSLDRIQTAINSLR
jgi:hypothetical protein